MKSLFPQAIVNKLLSGLRRDRLTRRERRVLIVGSLVGIGMLIYGLFSSTVFYLDRMKGLDRLIRQKEQTLVELARIRTEYALLSRQMSTVDDRIQKDQGRFSLLSYLESLSNTTQIRTRIAYMRPQPGMATDQYRETSVEMKVENVTLDQAVRFLSSIEQAPHVLKIKNLHFKTRFANPQFLDVTFLVSTYEKAG